MPKLDQSIADKVSRDRLPRQAVDEEGVIHILFWGGKVRSMLGKDWQGTFPTGPTEEESRAAIVAHEASALAERITAQQLRATIIQVARGVEGKVLNTLTQAEVRALVAVLLDKEGAVTKELTIKPLSEWT